MRPNISGSIVGYLTAYILYQRTGDPVSKELWRGVATAYRKIIRIDWGWK